MVSPGAYGLSSAEKLGQDLAPTAELRMGIAVGVIVAITSFMGCCGAVKDARTGCWRKVLFV